MELFSSECNIPRKGNASGALERISHVLRGLDKSLVELGEVQDMLEQEAMRACNDGFDDVEGADGVHLLLVANRLRKMVGALISDVKADPEVRKALPVPIQEDFATSNYNKLRNDAPIDVVEPGAEPCGLQTACIPDPGSRALKRIAVESLACCYCRRSFGLNPLVWSRLPDHLLGLVFARLPLREVSLVPCLSKAWLATSKTPSFRGLCAAGQGNSKLFGIVSLYFLSKDFWLTAYDVNTRKWHYRELDIEQKYLGIDYRPAGGLFAHDGGLICLISDPGPDNNRHIVVCNPLTNLWKKVLLIDHEEEERPVAVQLVRNAETGCYRVMLVWLDREGKFAGAECYNSETGLWSTLNVGHVYGNHQSALVFDCQQGVLLNRFVDEYEDANQLVPFGCEVGSYAAIGDRVCVLHWCPRERRANPYSVTEFAWESSTSTFSRRLESHECPLPEAPDSYQFSVLASSGFILLVANSYGYGAVRPQTLRLFDRTTEEWQDLPELEVKSKRYDFGDNNVRANTLYQAFINIFMCDLRWDAVP